MAPRQTSQKMLDQILHHLHQVEAKLTASDAHSSAILRELRKQGRLLMALSANEQKAVNDLSAAVSTLATDLAVIEAAAVDASKQIADLIAKGTADAATIAELQAIQASMDADVVNALSPITQHLTDMDHDLTSPATPAAPLSAQP